MSDRGMSEAVGERSTASGSVWRTTWSRPGASDEMVRATLAARLEEDTTKGCWIQDAHARARDRGDAAFERPGRSGRQAATEDEGE